VVTVPELAEKASASARGVRLLVVGEPRGGATSLADVLGAHAAAQAVDIVPAVDLATIPYSSVNDRRWRRTNRGPVGTPTGAPSVAGVEAPRRASKSPAIVRMHKEMTSGRLYATASAGECSSGADGELECRKHRMHVAQLTAPGSGCSIVFRDLPAQREMAPGSMKGLQLVVADARAAREELLAPGVEAGEITLFDERDGGTFFGFQDPEGNSCAVQEIRARAEKPLIPDESSARGWAEQGDPHG
jgi:hypothetical protein